MKLYNNMQKLLFILSILMIQMVAVSQTFQSNHLLVINTYNKKGLPQKALNYYNNNITEDDKNINLQISIGTTYYMLGTYNKAATIFIDVNKLNPKKANYELAQCYARLGKAYLSTTYLRIHLEGKNRKMQRTIKSDNAFNTINNSDEWNTLWREKDWYSKYDLMYEDAQYEYDLNNYEEALSILDKLNSVRKSMVKAYYLKSLVYLKVNEPNNALVSINTAISKRSKIAVYYAIKSTIEIELNKPKRALKSISTAIIMDSTKVNYYFTRARAYLKLGKTDNAVNDLESLISLVPDFDIYNLAGQIYYSGQQYQNALKAYNKCIALQKYNPDIYISRGDTYQQMYAYEFAEKDYTMALDFKPFNGKLYYKRGLTRKLQHKREAACADFNKAFKYKYMKADDELRGYCQ